MNSANPPTTVLALDTSSPVVSIALAIDGAVAGDRTILQRESSTTLLPRIDEVLSKAGVGLQDLQGLLALQGPGSFTGLRVGLSTALGLHEALGLPAMAVPTLQVLAASAKSAPGRILAAVDARRGAWYAQLFSHSPEEASGSISLPLPLGQATWTPATDLPECLSGTDTTQPLTIVAMDVEGLQDAAPWPPGTRFLDPGPLASVAALLAAQWPRPWDPSTLTRPLYLRAPSVSRPKA